MSTLKDLTLVIPTYNRPEYIERNLKYWSGKDVSVLAMDGSNIALDNGFLASLGYNIDYRHLPISFHERLQKAPSLIKTKYAALMADDEFFPSNGLESCINFLESKSDYSCCVGMCMGFQYSPGKILLYPIKHRYATHTVNQNTALERISYHIGNYEVTTIYGVHRKESFIYALSNSVDVHFSSPYVYEMLFELSAASFGKSGVLQELSWLRSAENPPIHSDFFNRKLSIADWYYSEKYRDEVEYFLQFVVRQLIKIIEEKDLDEKIIRQTIENAIATRLSKTQSKVVNNNSFLKFHNLFQRIMNRFNRTYFIDHKRHMLKNIKKMYGIEFNEPELIEILKNIKDFHEKS